jgi:hypothetical protein
MAADVTNRKEWIGGMRCLACGAEMRLMQVARDETMMVSGYEHHALQCPACGEVERRMVFNSGEPSRAAEPAAPSAIPAPAAAPPAEPVSRPTAPPAATAPAVERASPPTVPTAPAAPTAAAALPKPMPSPTAPPASASPAVKPEWPSIETMAQLAKSPSPATAPLKSIVAEDDGEDGGQAMLQRAIEMVRSSTRRAQPAKSQPTSQPATPAKLARPMRMKKPVTDRVVEICHDPHEAIYFAKDTKSGLSVLRHQDSARLRAMCDRIGWQVIEGGTERAKD